MPLSNYEHQANLSFSDWFQRFILQSMYQKKNSRKFLIFFIDALVILKSFEGEGESLTFVLLLA